MKTICYDLLGQKNNKLFNWIDYLMRLSRVFIVKKYLIYFFIRSNVILKIYYKYNKNTLNRNSVFIYIYEYTLKQINIPPKVFYEIQSDIWTRKVIFILVTFGSSLYYNPFFCILNRQKYCLIRQM